jgi:hypothetical protein
MVPLKLRRIAFLFTLALAVGALQPDDASGQKPARRTRSIRFEPNVHAPELYADKLTMQFMLVNLPGAGLKGTTWRGEYKLYFITEAEFARVKKTNLQAEDFTNKTLLAEGEFRKDGLATPLSRSFVRTSIAFKARVPDAEQTKFAKLLTVYSVKIYDAKLKTTLYKSGFWIAHIFDTDELSTDSGKTIPRKTVYSNFFVAPDGDLYIAQWRHEINDASW